MKINVENESSQMLQWHVGAPHKFGWIACRNVRIDLRGSGADTANDLSIRDRIGSHWEPDVSPATGSLPAEFGCLRQRADCRLCSQLSLIPRGVGIVDSLARPGVNVTGFMLFEYTLSA